MANNTHKNSGEDLRRIHKAITRALDISLITSQNKILNEKIRQGFITYQRVLTIILHAHHDGEEQISFPFWLHKFPEGKFNILKEQHYQISDALNQLDRWIKVAFILHNQDEMNKLNKILIRLQEQWIKHIELEEETIGPVNAAKYLTRTENEELSQKLAEYGQFHAQPSELVLPFIIYNLDGSDRNEYLKILPNVIVQDLIPYAWKNAWAPMTPFLLND